MANSLTDYYQAELNKAISSVAAWTPDPVVNSNNEIQVSVTDKLNILATLRQRAQSAQDSLNGLSFAAANASASAANINIGTYPAIFGVKVFADGGATGGTQASMTTEWGTLTNAFYRRFLARTAGLNDPLSTPSSYLAFAPNTTHFEISPYLVANCDRFRESCNVGNQQKLVSNSTPIEYQYPSRPFAILTLKNTNLTTAKTVTLDISGSSNGNNGNYTSFQVSVFTPDNTNSNRASITEAGTFASDAAVAGNPGWRNIINNTTNTGQVSLSPSIVVPADKTVLVIILAADYYWNGTAPVHAMSRHLQILNLNTTAYLDPHIVPDSGVLKNIMNKNLNNLGQLYSVIPA